jgi:hypothetical protein
MLVPDRIRRTKPTIRDLLFLTAIVAIAVGWWLDHRHLEAKYRNEREENQPLRDGIMLLRGLIEKTENDGQLKVMIGGEDFSAGSESDKGARIKN